MFETQKSRNMTSSGDIGLNIRTLASPKVGQDQVSGGVSVPCWHATPAADALWTLRYTPFIAFCFLFMVVATADWTIIDSRYQDIDGN